MSSSLGTGSGSGSSLLSLASRQKSSRRSRACATVRRAYVHTRGPSAGRPRRSPSQSKTVSPCAAARPLLVSHESSLVAAQRSATAGRELRSGAAVRSKPASTAPPLSQAAATTRRCAGSRCGAARARRFSGRFVCTRVRLAAGVSLAGVWLLPASEKEDGADHPSQGDVARGAPCRTSAFHPGGSYSE